MVMAEKRKIKVPRVEPLDLTLLPVKMPQIEMDYSKCTVPMWCKKCLQVCPQMVFKIYCKKMERGKESDIREPNIYEILPVRRDKCSMCGKCVEVCPEGALTVSFDSTVLRGTKKFDTATEAKKSAYPIFSIPRPYSFDLNADMLELLRQEFSPEKVVSKFAKAIEGKKKIERNQIAQEIFSEYGKQWMRKVLQFGEEYPDRTYEIMREMSSLTGELFFPIVPQRFIEIAYLSTQEFLKITIMENWHHRLVYQVPNCSTLRLLKEKCGQEIAEQQPCQSACIVALETLFQDLNVMVTIKREGTTTEKNYCQYTITSV
jgi:ferredoxin